MPVSGLHLLNHPNALCTTKQLPTPSHPLESANPTTPKQAPHPSRSSRDITPKSKVDHQSFHSFRGVLPSSSILSIISSRWLVLGEARRAKGTCFCGTSPKNLTIHPLFCHSPKNSASRSTNTPSPHLHTQSSSLSTETITACA
jgi:hypothetical protein